MNARTVRPSSDAGTEIIDTCVAPARILHVISGLIYGGGQRVVVDLLRDLPDVSPAEFQLCTLGSGGTALDSLADVSLPYDGRYNSPRTLWRTARSLRRVLRERRIDLVHTHGVDADLIAALAVCGTPTAHVCHLHITPTVGGAASWKSRLRRALLRRLTRRDQTTFIAVSEAVRQQTGASLGIPPERITTVRNGINVAEFDCNPTGRDSGNVVVGSAGRLERGKGLEHLVEAAGQLVRQNCPFELMIAGGGKLRESLEEQAVELGASERIRFVGHISDMPAFYRGLDIFVLPSMSEGLPLVVLEAMAAHVPVISTHLPGVREIIEDGVTGVLVPPGDSSALAAALQRLITDAPLRRRISDAGRQHVREHFTSRRMAEEISGVYERLLSEVGRR